MNTGSAPCSCEQRNELPIPDAVAVKQPHRPAATPLAPALKAQLIAAVGHHQRGDLGRAETLYREVLAAVPQCYDALHLLGVALNSRGAPAEGVELIRRAIAVDASEAAAHFSLARVLIDRRDAAAALATCETLTGLAPHNADAWFLRGNALQLAGIHDQAVESYDRALHLQPNLAAALNNQGHSLRLLRRSDQALSALTRALALQPGYAMALNNQGLALLDLHRTPEALQSFNAALAASPVFPEALFNRGTTLLELRRFAEAVRDFADLVLAAPHLGGALGNLLYARRNCCDWRDDESICAEVVAAVRSGALAATPLSFLCTSDSPQAQLTCAQTFTAARYPPRPLRVQGRWPYAHDRIRVAYVSGDFGAHAVSYLLAGVLECHDRERFETTAVAWGRQNDGPMRKRLEAAFGRFVEATARSDREIATLLRDLEIDIAVDLTGHTSGQRTEIFAHRCAPLQVNYLGFPGTSGAPYMDYLFADAAVVPAGEESAYSEQVVRLPHCFLPTDDRRSIAGEAATRAAAGLPAHGFVFCAFNNPVKITPEVFGMWLRLLRELAGSVLWLRADTPDARANLSDTARRQGVEPARLVFAPAISRMESHLARYRLADLFLDTQPYNAHATACDALWAGLPVLTCRGRSFAGRVGASLLTALGLPELVAESLQEYERLALDLARDPPRLAGLRARLERLRHASPVFDTTQYCRHLESAYTTMWGRVRAGLPPEGFAVEPRDSAQR
jgi:protein O-GlcNAc transferase